MDATTTTHNYTNALIHESSPYLLQHAHNPVNWVPWSEEALQTAKNENKFLIISIGYAACHWCHVMEHESFEDTAVAALMNRHFVCIKVDREERPDVDQVYMNAAQLITGSGGWPLNALALPDGKPFYAGTYFPKQNWMKMLSHFVEMKSKNPEAIAEQAQKVTEGIKSSEMVTFSNEKSIASIEDLNSQFANWKPSIDFEKGGENRAPKFPMPCNWEYLLEYHQLTQNKEALKAVTVTLDNMAMGGIYDQIAGGFSRYSTDEDWLAPHFEKMLYDNAQLVSLYSHAFQVTKNPLYRQTVYQTLSFVERELTSPEYGFYSSLDADSEGEEGRFYVWTHAEIQQHLGEEASLFSEYYQLTKNGNWEEGKNILHRKVSDQEFAKKHGLNENELNSLLEKWKTNLLSLREKRVRPGTDDKILCSWNALMLKGYVDAYQAFGEERFLAMALKNAAFLRDKLLQKNNELFRNYKNGKASIPALLDDYAFTISAFISLYQVTFDEKWLYTAKDLNDYVFLHFFDASSGMFFYTHNLHASLIARKMEVSDNVIPASNSEMAKNLVRLSLYFENEDYLAKSKQMFLNVQHALQQNIRYYSNWALLEIMLIQQPFEIAIVGKECQVLRKKMQQHFIPNALWMGGETEGSLPLLEGKLTDHSLIYVCRNKQCKAPSSTVEEALSMLKNAEP